ncbi:MAG: hypothetical protein SOZ59_04680 [Candidatus Limivivens sp.]|nr:hypothetical protein [Candidatus Limivivens sp.]
MDKFEKFRKEFPRFFYHGYEKEELADTLTVTYHFEIEGLSSFAPRWIFQKSAKFPELTKENKTLETMLFSLGMVELVSYWKITCSPQVIVEAGVLNQEQIAWWKDLYFNGQGEFFYTNQIETTVEDFMDITAVGKEPAGKKARADRARGCLIPIGGGKDSAVTLELLKKTGETCRCYIINPRGATINTTAVGGFSEDQVIVARRTLDKNMLELNKQGYLNGHTPFSALVAFSATIAAYLQGLRYIALSNESSANESTVLGSTVNHQYSKSFKFEEDFHRYEERWIDSGTYYFSMLRPLSEFQIARYFAKCRAYHPIFRSCNVGSKEDIWCGHCPKCLFVYLILSPFLSRAELKEIFGKDMLEDPEMIPIMEQLIGICEEKPFECVGSRSEINTAITLAIQKLEEAGEALPVLFTYYRTTTLYETYRKLGDTYSAYYDRENLLPEQFRELVERECIG